MPFHVYVEGAVDQTPDGLAKLAGAIAGKFGLPATDITARLSAGRFRVKANVDRATADTYVRMLQELGARAKIEEVAPTGTPSPARTGGSSLPPPAARPSSTALPPPALPRTNTGSSLPPSTGGGAKPAQMSSGLSAAFSQSEGPAADLGALGGDLLSLASLDGNDDSSPSVSSLEAPEQAGLPASIGLAALPPLSASATAKSGPLDLFAPPDAAEGDALVELAAEEVEHRERKANTPPAGVPTTPVLRKSQPSLQPPVLGGTSAPSRELTRAKFAAGVILAILIGFVPAHIVASMREKSAFTEIDNAVKRTQALATDDQSYAALDGFRTAQLSAKQSKQRSIALTSVLLWAALSAGLAYVWFRRVPWEKFSKPAT